MSGHAGSMKAVIFALGGNILIAIIKYIVALVTASTAMFAEAIHSTADCFNQVFLLIGNKRSTRAATEMHSFGYGKEEYFWGFMVALLLFFVGAIISLYEGIKKVGSPEEIHQAYWAIGVLAISILIESKSFSVAYKEFKKKYAGTPFFQALRDCTDTNLFIILLEDFAALVGLGIVLITTLLAWFVNPVFDAIGSILVGLLLSFISYFLTVELKKLMIGESVDRETRNEIKKIIHTSPIVKQLLRMQTMMIGGNKFLLLISVDVVDDCRGQDVEDHFNKMKMKIREQFQDAGIIYIEAHDAERSVAD